MLDVPKKKKKKATGLLVLASKERNNLKYSFADA